MSSSTHVLIKNSIDSNPDAEEEVIGSLSRISKSLGDDDDDDDDEGGDDDMMVIGATNKGHLLIGGYT